MPCFLVEAQPATAADALAVGPALLAEAERSQAIWLGATVVPYGERLVLGALQRAGRVLTHLHGNELRRSTSGVAARLDGGLVLSLALPAVDAALPDATARTLLNRNLRPLLRGLAAAGLPCAYLGRDWIALRRAPLFVVGFEVSERGAVLIEALATLRGSLALPRDRTTDLEASVERFGGRTPLALGDVIDPAELLPFARRAQVGAAERIGQPFVAAPAPLPLASWSAEVARLDSPLPAGALALAPRPIANGLLDVARTPHGAWVGGDLLAPAFALGAVAAPTRRDDATLPIEGALWDDVRLAREQAE